MIGKIYTTVSKTKLDEPIEVGSGNALTYGVRYFVVNT